MCFEKRRRVELFIVPVNQTHPEGGAPFLAPWLDVLALFLAELKCASLYCGENDLWPIRVFNIDPHNYRGLYERINILFWNSDNG